MCTGALQAGQLWVYFHENFIFILIGNDNYYGHFSNMFLSTFI
jgi:hypothetical protein